MGEAPEWYELIVAAKYLRVAPWELLERPVVWKAWALAAASAEAASKRSKEESARRKAKH